MCVTMTDSQRQARIGLLVSAHLLLGLILALIAFCYPALQRLMWASVAYMGLVGTETLLLGMWAGFSRMTWWMRLAGLLSGMAWIECLALATAPRPNASVFRFIRLEHAPA